MKAMETASLCHSLRENPGLLLRNLNIRQPDALEVPCSGLRSGIFSGNPMMNLPEY